MHNLIRLLKLLRPFTGLVCLSIILGALTVGSSIGLLGTSAYIIAFAALHPSIALLQVAIVGVRFFGISRAVSRYLERLASHSVNFRLLERLRVDFYRSIEPRAPAIFQKLGRGDLLGRAVADIESLENFYVRAAAPPVVALLVTAITAFFIGQVDLRLGWVLAGGLFLTGFAVPACASLAGKAPGRSLVITRGQLYQKLVDTVQGAPDLVAYRQEDEIIRQLTALEQDSNHQSQRVANVGAAQSAFMLLFSNLTSILILSAAIPLVTAGSVSGITLAVLVLITAATFEVTVPLGSAAQNLGQNLQAAGRLFAVSGPGTGEAIPSPEQHRPDLLRWRESGPPLIAVHDLSFRYDENQPPVLQGISLDFKPGQQYAVVGPSGAGKTSLAYLLLGFYPVLPGQIQIGGRDYYEIPPGEMRSMISMVGQSSHIFSGTVRRNLLIAKPDASDPELAAAIRDAGLEGWLSELPDRLDTWIGERGATISGGEAQRLALARALLQDTPVWLFDEPTANLDAITAAKLLQTLRLAGEGRTQIWITHRLAGLERMDEILVLDQGRVIERSRHAELLGLGGKYCRMWQQQIAWIANEE